MRYTKLNDFYVLDNHTGQKLDQKRTIQTLNKYESCLQHIKMQQFSEHIKKTNKEMEGSTTLDENGVLWRFTNGRWQAGCMIPKEMKK